MKRLIWLVWLLLSLMVILTPMAWASPPDPIWITGIYDDLDFDDGVVYLTCGSDVPRPLSDLTAAPSCAAASRLGRRELLGFGSSSAGVGMRERHGDAPRRVR